MLETPAPPSITVTEDNDHGNPTFYAKAKDDQRITTNMSTTERNALREYAKQAQWKAALKALQLEVGVVHIAARTLAEGQALTDDDLKRVGVACDRIRDAREVLTNGR